MTLLPRPVVHFFPFFEGATLYRQATLQLSVLNQNEAIIWSLLNDVGTPDGVDAALQRKFPLDKDRATGGVQEAVKIFLIMIFCIKNLSRRNLRKLSKTELFRGYQRWQWISLPSLVLIKMFSGYLAIPLKYAAMIKNLAPWWISTSYWRFIL